jgi:Amt family ammonium transporter
VGPGVYSWYAEGAGPATGILFGGGIQQLLAQLIGVIAVGGFTCLFSLGVWLAIKAILGIRVSPGEELRGLDISEHGMEAYTGLVELRKS